MHFHHAHITLLSIASAAVAALLTNTAMAQEYAAAYAVNGGTQEEVTITGPRHYSPWQSDIGAPYRMHSMSVPVSYRDLNLHTGDGVYTLRQRVKFTAHEICKKLTFQDDNRLLPVTDGCYYRAVTNASPQADAAVWNYRSP